MTTLLAKKATNEKPFALDDDRHNALASDPAVSQFVQGSTFGEPYAATSPTLGTTTPSPTPAAVICTSSISAPAIAAVAVAPNPAMIANTGGAMQEGADILVKTDAATEHWINSKWRPAMGWLYMLTCAFDFIIFPILWSLLQAMSKGAVTSQWMPLTLQGAGLYHIAMGAILGIAAYGRTKEKVAGGL